VSEEPLVTDLVTYGTKTVPETLSRGPFSLVAGVGFEPTTSGL
jgi:hypothetical protein